jgi:hypothetical protein
MPTLPEQIRITLGRRDGVPEDGMRSLADAYSAEVARVNERLSKSVALLRKGLRSEAIQLASMNPNALDAAAALDFPEFGDWCEVLQFLGIPVPAEVQRDLADQIHEAIVDTQPLEGMLRKHRRLAIARAPLAWRLNTLRAIAKLDPTNPVWEEDIEALEVARLRQLSGEVDSAIKSADLNWVKQLYDELTKGAWRVEMSPTLARRLKEAIDNAEQLAIGNELAKLAQVIHASFCEFDEASARQAVAKWKAAAAKYKKGIPAELTDQTDSALAWLQEIDREAAEREERSVALGSLQSLLDVGAPRFKLEAAYDACTRFDQPLPEDLIHRYRAAIADRELSAKRRNRALLASIFSLAVIAVGALVFWQRKAAFESRIVQAEAELALMLEQERFTDAKELWDRLKSEQSELVSDLRLVSLHENLKARISDEEDRRRQFSEYMRLADVAGADAMDPSALAKAEGLAVTEEEKAEAFKVRRQYTQWTQQLATEQTTKLLDQVSKAREQLDRLETLPPDSVDSSQLMTIVAGLDELPAAHPRASSAAKSQVQSTRTRAMGIRDALQQRRQRMQVESSALKKIVEATSLDGLQEALDEFAERLPESPFAEEFVETSKERAIWENPAKWNEFAKQAGLVLAQKLNSAKAQELDQDFQAIDAEFGENPAADNFGEIADRLERYSDRSKHLDEVLQSLKDTTIADLFTVRDGSGNRYFLFRDYYDKNREMVKNPRWFPEIVVNAVGAVKRQQELTAPYEVFSEPYDTILWLASQSQTRGDEFSQDWDREFLRLIGELRNRPHLDHMLKEMIIQHLVEGACEQSDLLSAKLTMQLLLLQQRSSKRANWFDPASLKDTLDAEVETQVIVAIAELYRSLPSIDQIAMELQSKHYVWSGLLLRDARGDITVSLKQVPDKQGLLFVAMRSSSQPDKADMVQIGSVQNGQVVLSPMKRVQSAGRPVFFLADP